MSVLCNQYSAIDASSSFCPLNSIAPYFLNVLIGGLTGAGASVGVDGGTTVSLAALATCLKIFVN